MQRYTVIRENLGLNDSMDTDDESLLIQLCEHLYKSGFLFDDSSEEEKSRGEGVINDFFEQEAEVFKQYLPRKKLLRFINYLKSHGWTEERLRIRLHQKITEGFDKFSFGLHHQFNIRQVLKRRLKEKEPSTLQDFLLFLEAYKLLFLNNAKWNKKEGILMNLRYTAQDLLRMRKELKVVLEGKYFVQLVLKEIARQRGLSISSLIKDHEREIREPADRTVFIRPSKRIKHDVRPGTGGLDHSR